jgi:3'(2'), 5'-bisphosphate nucleotidase
MNNLSSLQAQQIRQIIRQAGKQAKRMATEPFEVSQKGPNDFVTSVDRALDQQLAAQFTTWFPQDGVITEENAQSTIAFHQPHHRLWLIDPLDGTDDYIQGHSGYAVMVGLLQDYQPIAGWIYNPAADQLYYGGQDWGLFQAVGEVEPQALQPIEPIGPSKDFCPILIGYKDAQTYGQVIAQVIPEAQFYSLGSFGLKVMEVICGRVGLYLYLNGRVKLWDTTGPLALAKVAGLVCCDLEGQPLGFTPDAVDLRTLAHHQSILIGWPRYIELLRPRLREAIALVTA